MDKIKNFFGFYKMVSTKILISIYIIGALAIIAFGINLITQGGINIIAGLLVLLLGSLVWRIICELWILLFKMYDLLKKVKEYLQNLSDSIH
jgi:hypothetical protein